MSSIVFSLNESDLEKIENKIRDYGAFAEERINSYLRESASQMGVDSIILLIPQSRRKWKGKGKPARSGNPFITDFINLGFKIHTKNKYHYLYFPDQGEGNSRKNAPLEFMEKGLDKVYEAIVDGIINNLQKEG